MKTKYYFFAALAGLTLASCSSNDFVGDNGPNELQNGTVENDIRFSSGTTALTRADLYGSAAAAKLSNKFVVYGIKHVSDEGATATNDAVVFNNFQVGYTANTAGTTASNSSDWEYVDLQAYDATPTNQGIKYWDYSADKGYTFYAFSSSDISYPKATSDKVQVTKTTSDGTTLYNKGYEVTVKDGATLNNLYFSDRVEVSKGDYGKTVDLTFRNIGAQVRVGFYETIPGYSVKIDKFYIDNGNPKPTAPVTNFAAMNDPMTDGFYASLQNVTSAKTDVDQTLNVTYYPATTATEVINRPKLTNPTAGYDYSLKLGDGTGFINTTLGTAANSPTWAVSGGAYTPVFPFEANSQPLLIKLDFTMYADDGSSDVIHVRGARAIVPVQYVQWKSNFAYTYLFKISDKSNGTTGDVDANDDPTDPEEEGLKAITFDAIVVDVDDNLQQTITSVSTNSITTYANGAIVNEYNNNKPIYVTVSKVSNNSVITPSGIGDASGEAQVYKLSKATTEAAVLAQLNGLAGDFTKTVWSGATVENNIPLVDGTNPKIKNVKFTPTETGYYAFVYTTTKYAAPSYLNQSGGTYDSSKTYYMRTDDTVPVYYAASVPTSAAFDEHKAQLYIIDPSNAGTPGVYDVKVIKVQ